MYRVGTIGDLVEPAPAPPPASAAASAALAAGTVVAAGALALYAPYRRWARRHRAADLALGAGLAGLFVLALRRHGR